LRTVTIMYDYSTGVKDWLGYLKQDAKYYCNTESSAFVSGRNASGADRTIFHFFQTTTIALTSLRNLNSTAKCGTAGRQGQLLGLQDHTTTGTWIENVLIGFEMFQKASRASKSARMVRTNEYHLHWLLKCNLKAEPLTYCEMRLNSFQIGHVIKVTGLSLRLSLRLHHQLDPQVNISHQALDAVERLTSTPTSEISVKSNFLSMHWPGGQSRLPCSPDSCHWGWQQGAEGSALTRMTSPDFMSPDEQAHAASDLECGTGLRAARADASTSFSSSAGI
jgi:hypothetical protein